MEAGWTRGVIKGEEDGGETSDAVGFRDRDTEEKTGGRARGSRDAEVLFGRNQDQELVHQGDMLHVKPERPD